MTEISVDLSKRGSAIRPLNAVNNGPMFPDGGVRKTATNFEAYKAAGFSYARLHDTAFAPGCAGEHLVDVHRIFKNFDADENDPASYVFGPTDRYILNIIAAGTKVFYRLGAAIEHQYKYGTLPPKDFAKWARICEHIILHYNEGWADGYHLGIEYWEIWNEPDTGYKQNNSPTWGGTMDAFFELFEITLYHLKAHFPQLKIGGPALCSVTDSRDIFEDMLRYLNRNGKHAPLDFFSWHLYGEDVTEFEYKIRLVQQMLEKYGYGDAENILNEWNYVLGWTGEKLTYSYKMNKAAKGAAFVAGAMCVGQALGLDMLMYYEGRPKTPWCGLFAGDENLPTVTYGVYPMFARLLSLGTHVPTEWKDGVYSCAATDGEKYGLLLTRFKPDDATEPEDLALSFSKPAGAYKVSYHLLNDENPEGRLVREEYFTADTFRAYIKMKNFDTYYISVEKM
ncbi:MAG: hypothetical protein IJY71_08450 [Clostridia bacterium]|nr:hypothetical protein [Clostridia bacterium]